MTTRSGNRESEVKLDKQGRVIDASGRPLRDRRARGFGRAPFQGRPGKPHPRQKILEKRIELWEVEDKRAIGFRRKPGSLKK